MKYLLIAFLFSSLSFAQVERLPVDEAELNDIYVVNNEMINDHKNPSKKLRLDRFDLQVGLTAAGDLGVLTFSGSSAVELVWLRNFKDKAEDDLADEETIDLEIDPYQSEEDVYKQMYTSINSFFSKIFLKPRFERRVLRKLRKDAFRINSIVNDLSTMPAVDNWYVDGFFQTYGFSVSGSLIDIVKIGYSKRIRFRFKINQDLLLKKSLEELSKKQTKLKKLMHTFEHMRSKQGPEQFKFYRVRAGHTFGLDLDLGLVEISKSRGFVIEYRRLNTPVNELLTKTKSTFPKMFSGINHLIARQFSKKQYRDDPDTLSLKQIRIKYGFEPGVGFKILTLSKDSTMEFHYKR